MSVSRSRSASRSASASRRRAGSISSWRHWRASARPSWTPDAGLLVDLVPQPQGLAPILDPAHELRPLPQQGLVGDLQGRVVVRTADHQQAGVLASELGNEPQRRGVARPTALVLPAAGGGAVGLDREQAGEDPRQGSAAVLPGALQRPVRVALDHALEAAEVRVPVGGEIHVALLLAPLVEVLQGEGQQGEAAGLADGLVHQARLQVRGQGHGASQVQVLHRAGDHAGHGHCPRCANTVLAAVVLHGEQAGVVHALVQEVRAHRGDDPEAWQLGCREQELQKGLAQGLAGRGEELFHLVEDEQPFRILRQAGKDAGEQVGEGGGVRLELLCFLRRVDPAETGLLLEAVGQRAEGIAALLGGEHGGYEPVGAAREVGDLALGQGRPQARAHQGGLARARGAGDEQEAPSLPGGQAPEQLADLDRAAEEDGRLPMVQGQEAGVGIVGPGGLAGLAAQGPGQRLDGAAPRAGGETALADLGEEGAQGRRTALGGRVVAGAQVQELAGHRRRLAFGDEGAGDIVPPEGVGNEGRALALAAPERQI